MSDQQNKNGNDTSDLLNALREMGQQLEATFRTTLESEKVKQLQQDLTNGVREITSQVSKAAEQVQEDPRFQQAQAKGREVFEQAQQSPVLQDIQDALVKGIYQISEQLKRVAERVERSGTAKTTAQDVPVDHEPNTGETTKLD